MSTGHHHEVDETMGDKRLALAIIVNMLLTVAQVVGGVISGSLSLIADALHNFSDAASLLIAWVARKIGRQPADHFRTFGYKRAEVVATLINLVSLVLIGLYLIFEALWRIHEPQIIEGWIVVVVAGVALVIDVITAVLTYSMSKHSMNIRAAFLHNVSDALASVGVIIAGTLILLYQTYWVDTLITLLIAVYVLYQAATMLPKTVNILMQGMPDSMTVNEVVKTIQATENVSNVHHIHIWQLDEHNNALEAHVVINDFSQINTIKAAIKQELLEKYSIKHSTLEFEESHCTEKYC